MIAFDTNILFPAVIASHAQHQAARTFLEGLQEREDIAISEFALVELYVLLRNQAVVSKPLSAPAAAAICESFRNHPQWRIVGFAAESRTLHDALWQKACAVAFPRRRIFDLRMAMSLIQQGVTEFATVNPRDFEGAGFRRVWNPLG